MKKTMISALTDASIVRMDAVNALTVMDANAMIDNLIAAWQLIFQRHPNSEAIMDAIMDPHIPITSGQFRKWYAETLEAK